MARETTSQRNQSTSQRADQSGSESFDKSRETRSSNATNAAAGQADRERSIQTDREGSRSTGITRRQGSSPVYGSTASPYQAMRRMADDMDRLFESFGFGRGGLGLSPFGSDLDRDSWRAGSDLQSVWVPQVETFRRGDKLVVRADLPGLSKDDVKVEVEDGQLSISGERCEENEENRDDYYRSERSYGQFYRAIPLPEGVNADQCEASFKDGVLEITLAAPKETERKAKRVQIR
jgi:HSP20 family protein